MFFISQEGLSYREWTVHVRVIKCHEKLCMPTQYHNDCIWTFPSGIVSDYYTYYFFSSIKDLRQGVTTDHAKLKHGKFTS